MHRKPVACKRLEMLLSRRIDKNDDHLSVEPDNRGPGRRRQHDEALPSRGARGFRAPLVCFFQSSFKGKFAFRSLDHAALHRAVPILVLFRGHIITNHKP